MVNMVNLWKLIQRYILFCSSTHYQWCFQSHIGLPSDVKDVWAPLTPVMQAQCNLFPIDLLGTWKDVCHQFPDVTGCFRFFNIIHPYLSNPAKVDQIQPVSKQHWPTDHLSCWSSLSSLYSALNYFPFCGCCGAKCSVDLAQGATGRVSTHHINRLKSHLSASPPELIHQLHQLWLLELLLMDAIATESK